MHRNMYVYRAGPPRGPGGRLADRNGDRTDARGGGGGRVRSGLIRRQRLQRRGDDEGTPNRGANRVGGGGGWQGVRWKIPICCRGPAGSISSSVALFGFLDDITLGDGNNARSDRGVRRRVTAAPGMDVICRENDRVIVRPGARRSLSTLCNV